MSRVMRRGDLLPLHLQQHVLRSYVHRHTGDHKPAWARSEWKDGQPYPIQFRDDAEWLAHSYFPIHGLEDDRTSWRVGRGSCLSYPTWPCNPDLIDNNLARVLGASMEV
ncbi:hypothetical protein [Sphingomonas melonis]|uniref:hypothetical protein n=1 Tax=Sphingomonas melonis TaxID=152682 RepID=UPI0035C869EA